MENDFDAQANYAIEMHNACSSKRDNNYEKI